MWTEDCGTFWHLQIVSKDEPEKWISKKGSSGVALKYFHMCDTD